jgi:hypothetical protein
MDDGAQIAGRLGLKVDPRGDGELLLRVCGFVPAGLVGVADDEPARLARVLSASVALGGLEDCG